MTGYTPTRLVAVQTNATGAPVNESHHWHRWSDEVVAQARALRAEGLSCQAISHVIGVPRRTVSHWCSGARRRATARVMMVRRKTAEVTNE